jgi:hypothetical protein
MKPEDILMINYNLFKSMKELAEKQEKVILDDQMDEFVNLLNRREQLRKEINANSDKYSLEIKKRPVSRSDQQNKTIFIAISDTIRSIQETDKRIEEFIVARKTDLLDDIKGVKKGQTAVKRYGGDTKKISRFFDKNG